MGDRALLISLAAAFLAAAPGCAHAPPATPPQGTVTGGTATSASDVTPDESDPLLGSLFGSGLGAGSGYLLGSQIDHVKNQDLALARQAIDNCLNRPATPDQARAAATADVNSDGFVTADEVVAMNGALLSDQEMITRLSETKQVFALSPEQKEYLVAQGVSRAVVDQMPQINREQREALVASGGVRSAPR